MKNVLRKFGDRGTWIWRLGDWGIWIWKLGDWGIRKSESPILQISKSLFPILLISFLLSSQALAAFPQQINYQGKLTNASNIPVSNANYSIVFTIYDAASGT